MIVLKATAEQIEALNIDDFFTGHTLGKDINGLHYYSCERYCKEVEMNEEQKELFDSLEKVEFEELELEEAI